MTRAPNVHALNIYLSSIFRLRLSCPEGQISRSVGQIFTALNLAELNSTVVGLLINLVNMFIIYNTTIYSNDWNISHCFITMFITMCPPAWHWHCCTLVQPLRLRLWHVDRGFKLGSSKNMPGDEWGAPGQPTKTKFQAPAGGGCKDDKFSNLLLQSDAIGNHIVVDYTTWIFRTNPVPFVRLPMMALWFHGRIWVVLYE